MTSEIATVERRDAPDTMQGIRDGARRPRSGFVVVGTLITGFLLLGMAWLMINPTPTGSDEPAHYIKALATARGEFHGPHVPFPAQDPNFPDVMYYWNQTTREFSVPALQAPLSTFGCVEGTPTAAATCTASSRCIRWVGHCTVDPPAVGYVNRPTYVGNYEPTSYLLQGLLAELANSDVNGLRAARGGSLAIAILLLGVAAACLWDRAAPLSLAGLVVSVTPMVIYINAVVNPNGGEIASSIAFTAALIRVTRTSPAPGWAWAAFGLAGFYLGFSRLFGPLWVVSALAFILLLRGFKPLSAAVLRGGPVAAGAIVAVIAGIASDIAWWQIEGIPKTREPLASAVDFLWLIVQDVPLLIRQQVAAFGWGEGDIHAGDLVYFIWEAMVLGLFFLAFLLGTHRQRIVLALAITGDLLFTVVTGAIEYVSFGFPGGTGTLGRYLLPLSVMVVLVAAEVVLVNRAKLGVLEPRRFLLLVTVGSATCQAVAFWWAARSYAVSISGPILFLGHSLWHPPFGWIPWLVMAATGCALLVAAGFFAVPKRIALDELSGEA